MIHNKNKALDDLYNYRSKQPFKNFKTYVQDYVPKPTPIKPIIKTQPTNIIIQKPLPVFIPDAPSIKNIIPKPTPVVIEDAHPQQKPIGKTNIYIKIKYTLFHNI